MHQRLMYCSIVSSERMGGAEVEEDIDIYVNCSWVDTRWQYTFTDRQYTEHHNQQQNNTNVKKQIHLEECWPCPVFANYILAFALQLRKKQEKTSVRVAEER
jgi:hypothetical protein